MKKAMTSTDPGTHGNPSTAVAVAANVAASAVEAAYEEGLARLKARAFERLELDERLEKLSEEVSGIATAIRINFISGRCIKSLTLVALHLIRVQV